MPLSENARKNKIAYSMQYNKKHYKRVALDVSFEKFDEIKAASEENNESINGYIKKAIDDRLKKDNML